jgi:hypothetical protein
VTWNVVSDPCRLRVEGTDALVYTRQP